MRRTSDLKLERDLRAAGKRLSELLYEAMLRRAEEGRLTGTHYLVTFFHFEAKAWIPEELRLLSGHADTIRKKWLKEAREVAKEGK